MYKRELKYMTIEYSDKDSDYIEWLCQELESNSEDVVSFFEIEDFGEKVGVKLWEDVEDFRNYYRNTFYKNNPEKIVPDWVCGFAKDGKVQTLCLEGYRKTHSHKDADIVDLRNLVLHEFVHGCHEKIGDVNCSVWLSEGFATTLSHQYDNIDKKFDATLEQMTEGGCYYYNYNTMFSYVLDTYGKDYVLELAKDSHLQEMDTPKLFKEVQEAYKQKIK